MAIGKQQRWLLSAFTYLFFVDLNVGDFLQLPVYLMMIIND